MVTKTKKKGTAKKSKPKTSSKSTKSTKSKTHASLKVAPKVKHRTKSASKSVSSKPKRAPKAPQGPIGFFIRNIEKFEHSIDFDISRGIFAAFLFMLISQAISFVGLSMNKMYFTNVEFQSLWSKLLLPVGGEIQPMFFLYSALVSLFVGFIYAFFYHMVRVSIHGHAPHKRWVKGLLYGIFLVFVYSIPMLLRDYLMLGAPSLLVVSWFSESVLTLLAGGVAIAVAMK